MAKSDWSSEVIIADGASTVGTESDAQARSAVVIWEGLKTDCIMNHARQRTKEPEERL